jgi:hypothetical protein
VTDETGHERDERVMSAELPSAVDIIVDREETLKAQAGNQCWHHFSVALKLHRRNAHMQAGCSSPVQRTKQAHT